MSLPEDKLVALQAVILDFLHRHRASKQQLQSLAGRLNWPGGVWRLHLSRMHS